MLMVVGTRVKFDNRGWNIVLGGCRGDCLNTGYHRDRTGDPGTKRKVEL